MHRRRVQGLRHSVQLHPESSNSPDEESSLRIKDKIYTFKRKYPGRQQVMMEMQVPDLQSQGESNRLFGAVLNRDATIEDLQLPHNRSLAIQDFMQVTEDSDNSDTYRGYSAKKNKLNEHIQYLNARHDRAVLNKDPLLLKV